MSDDMPTLSFGSVVQTLKTLAALCTAVATSSAFIGALIWYLAAPTLKPYLTAIAQIPEIKQRLDELELRVPLPPVLIFGQTAYIANPEIRAGDPLSIQYQLQRTESCTSTVIVRYYSYTLGGFDPRFTQPPRPTTRAPVTAVARPFKIVLTTPADMPPGDWAYAPEIIPGHDCSRSEVIYPPYADFTVLP